MGNDELPNQESCNVCNMQKVQSCLNCTHRNSTEYIEGCDFSSLPVLPGLYESN